MKIKGQCYDCQYKKRKNEIGNNKKAYEESLIGNTVSIGNCNICGKEKGLLPVCDMDRAIRSSNNEYIHPLEWD